MSDETTRAAERLRSGTTAYNADTDIGTLSWQQLSDFVTLANAYLREHPADDAEPVTEEWLDTLPCDERFNGIWYHFFANDFTTLVITMSATRCWASVEEDGSPEEVVLHDLVNRRQVRDLCRALGVELKEQW